MPEAEPLAERIAERIPRTEHEFAIALARAVAGAIVDAHAHARTHGFRIRYTGADTYTLSFRGTDLRTAGGLPADTATDASSD
jgi:hypothetical protein